MTTTKGISPAPGNQPKRIHVDLYEFVAEFSRQMLLREPKARIVLVGGAAFEWHFPKAHASSDADISVRISSNVHRYELLTDVSKTLGFHRTGRIYQSKEAWFTVDFAPEFLEVGSCSVEHLVEQARTDSGAPFLILSPAAMMFDRLNSWIHWNDAQSLLAARLAVQTEPDKIDYVELSRLLSNERGLQKIIAGLPEDDPLRRRLAAASFK
jgi:hypothetical protein